MTQAFDDAVNGAGGSHQTCEGGRFRARQDVFVKALTRAPNALFTQHHGQRLAGVQRLSGAVQAQDVIGQGPMNQHRSLALGLQAVDHAQGAVDLA